MYYVSNEELTQIKKHFGNEFTKKILYNIELSIKEWNIDSLELMLYFSVSCLFMCRSNIFGDCVLKICKSSNQADLEYKTLLEYNDSTYCNVYAKNSEQGILLLERIEPGTTLHNVTSLDKRLDIYCNLLKKIHKSTCCENIFPTYTQWIDKTANTISKTPQCKTLYTHMKKAQKLYHSLLTKYNRKLLLHGDLHHGNILYDNKKGYRIIDPKGVIGDPVFEIGRFILNEPYNGADFPSEHIQKIITGLSERLNLPEYDIMQFFYIELCLAECWHMEDGHKNYEKRLKNISFIEAMLDSLH